MQLSALTAFISLFRYLRGGKSSIFGTFMRGFSHITPLTKPKFQDPATAGRLGNNQSIAEPALPNSRNAAD
jgi:hypothetical protein